MRYVGWVISSVSYFFYVGFNVEKKHGWYIKKRHMAFDLITQVIQCISTCRPKWPSG